MNKRPISTVLLSAVFAVFVGVASGCGGGSGASSASAGLSAKPSPNDAGIQIGGPKDTFDLASAGVVKRTVNWVRNIDDKFAAEPDLEGEHQYIVMFEEAPAVMYEGGIKGYPATKPGYDAPRSAQKTSGSKAAKGSAKRLNKTGSTGRAEFKASRPEVQAYKAFLKSRQAEHVQKITQLTGRYEVTQEFQLAANAVVMIMTQDEARKVSRLPNVRFVERNRTVMPDTDRGPTWIGAPGIWDGSAYSGPGTLGEGVLVGIIDSGASIGVDLTPDDSSDWVAPFVGPLTHLSLVDPVDIEQDFPGLSDNYDHQWAGGYLGACDPTSPQYIPEAAQFCNDKLVGVYSFIDAWCPQFNPPRDSSQQSCDQYAPDDARIWNVKDTDGHGTHVASTAAGNFLNGLPIVDADGAFNTGFIIPQISGVAPHANIVTYKVCAFSCFFSDIAAATEQAIVDGVDVLNMSIGNTDDPWGSLTAQTFLSANTAGIAVANSAGNSGPGAGTATGANSAPWVLGVGASTHDRSYPPKFLDALSGGDTPPPTGISGLAIAGGFTGGIVYAGDFPVGVTGEPNFDQPEQCLEPFPPGTFPADTIVLCDRGAIARVAKGQNVRDGGAAAFILGNIQGGATSVVADPHVIPAIHIDADSADAVRAWLGSGTGHAGTITPGEPAVSDPAVADIMAGFSSRGPFPNGLDLLAPHVSAPGSDIYAAGAGNLFDHQGVGNEAPSVNALFGQISGTSMSSPHAAGSLALLTAIHPNWSADARHSALISTGTPDMRKEDGSTPADPFDFGGGRVQPAVAANVGLVFDESETNYQAANPADGGDPSTLNVAHAVSNACVQSCSWERTVTAVADGEWTVVPGDFTSADVTSFSLLAGETQTVVITADSSTLPADAFAFDTLGFAPTDPALAEQHVTIAVQPARGDIPENVNIAASRDADSLLVQNLTAIEITNLTTDVYGFNKADQEDFSVMQDSDNSSPYDDLTDGVVYKLIPFVDNAQRFIAEITASESPDLDMFVGLDFNGDGLPSEDEEFCVSASGTAFEVCDFELGGGLAGFPDWWVLIQNWGASAPPPVSDAFTLATTSVGPVDTGTLSLEGPSAQPQLEPFDVRLFWDAAMDQGDIFYGRINLFTDASGDPASSIGTMDVRAERGADDVVLSALPDKLQVGETATVTASVLKNFTPEDRTYEISIPIPAGLSYVDGSADASGGVFDGSAVNFSITQESLAGRTRDYAQYTNDPARGDYAASCTLPFGLGSYIDLAGFGIGPIAGGDDDTFAISGLQPLPFYGTDRGNAVNVNTNGFLFFDSTPGPFDGFINFPIPDTIDPNDMIAPLWKDLIVPDSQTIGGSGISAGGFTCGPPCFSVIEFDDATDWETETASYDAQAFIVASENLLGPYEIFIGFDNVDFGTPANDFVTVGVENPNGDQGTQYAYDTLTSSIASGLLVCYDLLPFDTAPDALSFQVTAASGSGGWTFDLTETDTVDSPGSQEDSSTTSIQVSEFLFEGFTRPVTDGGVYQINRTLPITILFVDANSGQPVPGANVGIVIYDESMNVVVDDVYGDNKPGSLKYLWRTGGNAPGEYTIATIFPDGFEYKIKVNLRDNLR